MRLRSFQAAGLAVCVLAVGLTGGCRSDPYGSLLFGPRAYKVRVKIDHVSFGDVLPSLEVDLVGINQTEKGTWENYPISKYYSPNDSLRRDADRIVIKFSREDRGDKILERTTPIWGKWVGKKFDRGVPGKGAQWLFVIVNLPGVNEDKPGIQDPRRVILPLRSTKWPFGTKEIDIVIKRSMVVCTTQQKSKD